MDSSSDARDKKLGTFPFVIGGLSYIPLFGVFFGTAAVVWGLVTKRSGGKRLALIGAGGIGFTILIYGALFYFGIFQRGGIYDELRQRQAQTLLNQLVQSIEFYHVAHGAYPASLDELQKASPNSTIFISDPTVVPFKSQPRNFYYERVGTDHYYLRSVGTDGQPFTPDDILPQIDKSLADKIGLKIDLPPSR